MDLNEDPRALEQKGEQATRIAPILVLERLSAWIGELRQSLRQRMEARRAKQEIRTRAREIWEKNGRTASRDLELASNRGRDQRTQVKNVKKRSGCGICACPQCDGFRSLELHCVTKCP